MSLILSLVLVALAASYAPDPDPGQFLEREHRGEHGVRKYRLYLPSGHDPARPAPLLVMLHGCTQDAADFAAGTRMNQLAEAGGFLVAYPEQPADLHPQKCWSWYEPAHQEAGAGEPALIAALTREVMADHGVDPARVHVAGISAGGAMALIAAAASPGLYAGVGVHSGIAYGAAASVQEALLAMRQGVPDPGAGAAALRRAFEGAALPRLIVFQGGADAVVAPANADALVEQWRAVLGPAPLEREEAVGLTDAGSRYTRRSWRRGAGEPALLESWLVDDLGHAWSGGSPEGTYTEARGPEASLLMVRFFLDPAPAARGR
jgi:poly(hydroxyalkanoate) depolymerase family esterase